jgi:hypothetical protein
VAPGRSHAVISRQSPTTCRWTSTLLTEKRGMLQVPRMGILGERLPLLLTPNQSGPPTCRTSKNSYDRTNTTDARSGHSTPRSPKREAARSTSLLGSRSGREHTSINKSRRRGQKMVRIAHVDKDLEDKLQDVDERINRWILTRI